jgi:hypothetical protein
MARSGLALRTSVLVVVPLVSGIVLLGCGASRPAVATSGIPPGLLLQARPIGSGANFRPPPSGPVIGRCRGPLGRRSGVHVELFADNRVVIVAAGIGARPPRRFVVGRISRAACYGSLVTLEPTGLVLVRVGSRPALSDLFQAWGQPLSPRRLASFSAPASRPVAVFVNGRRWHGLPGSVPLTAHSEIVLEVGPHVPPHTSYAFPPGT